MEARPLPFRRREQPVAVSRRLAALLAAVLVAPSAVACGGDDDGGGSSGDVPSGAVATVGDAEISEQALDEQVAVLARARRAALGDGDESSGGSDGSDDGGADSDGLAPGLREQLEAQALATLLMREAVEQEAADRGVEVADAEVRERWEAASQSQFDTKKELLRFLGGQTEDDLLLQIRLQLLTERIHEQVSEEAGEGKQGAKAVEQFQKDFQKDWQDRTACRDGYAAAGCASDDPK